MATTRELILTPIDTEPYMEIWGIRLIVFTGQWKIPLLKI
jgi:hypothetical protein